jgi:hypothetical protein
MPCANVLCVFAGASVSEFLAHPHASEIAALRSTRSRRESARHLAGGHRPARRATTGARVSTSGGKTER